MLASGELIIFYALKDLPGTGFSVLNGSTSCVASTAPLPHSGQSLACSANAHFCASLSEIILGWLEEVWQCFVLRQCFVTVENVGCVLERKRLSERELNWVCQEWAGLWVKLYPHHATLAPTFISSSKKKKREHFELEDLLGSHFMKGMIFLWRKDSRVEARGGTIELNLAPTFTVCAFRQVSRFSFA